MAIHNIQPIINDDLVRPKVDSLQRNVERTPRNTGNVQTANTIHPTGGADDRIDKYIMEDAIDKMNKTIQIFNKRIKLSFHEESKRVVIKVIDIQTDKVIKEIPPKEALNFISKLHESIGVLMDKKR